MRSGRSLALTTLVSALLTLAVAGPMQAKDDILDPTATPLVDLVATLGGDQVVPGPGAADTGTGWAEVVIDAAVGSLCWTISWEGIDDPITAAIRAGAPGVAGASLVDLSDVLTGGCLDALDTATLEAIGADPASYYVELATAAYPDGAIRGQLAEVKPVSFVTVWALLSDAAVLPDAGDPTAGGWIQLDIDVGGGALCAWWGTTGLDDATAAGLHAGAAGTIGDLVAALPLPNGAEPCQTGLDPVTLQAIVDDPAAYYVEVSTGAFPAGAARGQLSFDPPPPPPCSAPTVCDGALGAGDYEFYGFSRTLFFTLADEWLAANSGMGFSLQDVNGTLSVLGFVGLGAADSCGSSTIEVGTAPDALADFLAAHPALEGVTRSSVTIGFLPAIQLDATVVVPDGCGTPNLLLLTFGSGGTDPGSGGAGAELAASLTGDGFIVTSGDRVRLFLVDVDGGMAVFALAAPVGDGFDSLAGHAQSVLDSIAWGPALTPGDGGGGEPGAEAGGDDRGNGLPNTAMAPSAPPLMAGVLLLLVGLAGPWSSRRRHGSQIG
jgi:hypothetical protein